MKNLSIISLIFFQLFTNSSSFYSRFTNFFTIARDATDKYFNRFNHLDSENLPEEEISLGDFDFIIIGSGSSGSVLANRLSENEEWKILLLEAGRRGNLFTQIPLLAPVFQVTPYNWNYTMERQEGFCLAMEEQKCSWPRGKALGGTSVINYMIYTRGNQYDFDKWQQESPGWSYEDVLPYYLKSENCLLGEECNDSEYHRQGGLVAIEKPYSSEISEAFIEAGTQLGYAEVDYNTNNFMGFSRFQATIKHGRRVSAATAFLDPIWNRSNLHIVTLARATKILINNQTNEATGIEFVRRHKKYIARASKEVILSAGAFHSPQLLMTSGIGPKEHLKEHNIEVIKDLPVGKILYDHITFLGFVVTINKTIEPREALFNPTVTFDWLFNGKNFFSSLGGVESLAYINTLDNDTFPDVELILSGIGSLEWDRGLVSRPELRIKKETYEKYYKPLEKKATFSILPMLLHPKSKGEIKLASNNIFEAPLLFGNYLTDENGEDLKTMIRAIRFMQKLIKTEAFKKYNATIYDQKFPGCEIHDFDSNDYWECVIRHSGVTLHHQVATCKMGDQNEENSVVDSRGKVHGLKKLRVVDSSIIPVTLSAHINAACMMISEKISDDIKKELLL